jgi:hypothetical protein
MIEQVRRNHQVALHFVEMDMEQRVISLQMSRVSRSDPAQTTVVWIETAGVYCIN